MYPIIDIIPVGVLSKELLELVGKRVHLTDAYEVHIPAKPNMTAVEMNNAIEKDIIEQEFPIANVRDFLNEMEVKAAEVIGIDELNKPMSWSKQITEDMEATFVVLVKVEHPVKEASEEAAE